MCLFTVLYGYQSWLTGCSSGPVELSDGASQEARLLSLKMSVFVHNVEERVAIKVDFRKEQDQVPRSPSPDRHVTYSGSFANCCDSWVTSENHSLKYFLLDVLWP